VTAMWTCLDRRSACTKLVVVVVKRAHGLGVVVWNLVGAVHGGNNEYDDFNTLACGVTDMVTALDTTGNVRLLLCRADTQRKGDNTHNVR